MKKYFATIAVITLLAACGSNEPKQAPGTAAVNPDEQKGKELIAKSDCRTCHKDDSKLVGPAYQDVAAKYTADAATISTLADKVIKGGQGVWGQVPMTPHPTLQKPDVEMMIKYVLSLKK
jgi:cytochrome c